MAGFTHFNEKGMPRMVEVSEKSESTRHAVARGYVSMNPDTFLAVLEGRMKKGDALATAQIAGILGAKKTPELIPMCHPLLLTGIDMTFLPDEDNHRICITASVTCEGRTGVEMEALTAVSVAALTLYDMCKALQKDMVIGPIQLVSKSGGKSGEYLLIETDSNDEAEVKK